jgi:hypothetical protein
MFFEILPRFYILKLRIEAGWQKWTLEENKVQKQILYIIRHTEMYNIEIQISNLKN